MFYQRNLVQFLSFPLKRIAQISSLQAQDKTKPGTISTNEMDTHADAYVAGKNALGRTSIFWCGLWGTTIYWQVGTGMTVSKKSQLSLHVLFELIKIREKSIYW